MMITSTELPGHFVSRTGFLKPAQRTKQRNQTFRFGVSNVLIVVQKYIGDWRHDPVPAELPAKNPRRSR
jgi:hypothetical protein